MLPEAEAAEAGRTLLVAALSLLLLRAGPADCGRFLLGALPPDEERADCGRAILTAPPPDGRDAPPDGRDALACKFEREAVLELVLLSLLGLGSNVGIGGRADRL